MSNQDALISETKAAIDADLKQRQKSIEDGEALDKIIHRRMAAGEIGISHGADHYVSVLMLGTAAVVAVLALYFVFGVSPTHYLQG